MYIKLISWKVAIISRVRNSLRLIDARYN